MTPPPGGVEAARAALVPLLEALDAQLSREDADGPRLFFAFVRDLLAAARDPDDLAGPFLELSTTAFRDFTFSPAALRLVDEVLARAHDLALTLSADGTGH